MSSQKNDCWNPEQYDRFQKERSQPFYDLLALVQPLQDGQTRAVDLGCGSGELTSILHTRLQLTSTLGLDTSTAMLAKAAQFELREPASKVRFTKSSIEEFNAREEYDLVFSNAAVQWCGHHEDLLRNFARALKPRGQLAIQMPTNHDYATHTLASQMRREEPYRTFWSEPESPSSLLLPETYAHLLFRLGFREQRVFTQVYAHVLDDREAVIEWVKGTLLTGFESRLPVELFSLFLEEYRIRLFEKLPDDRPFFYPFKRLLIWGRL